MTFAISRINSFSLSAFDIQRLQWLAPQFDLELLQTDAQSWVLRQHVGAVHTDTPLATHFAHRRLLAEICAKAAPWVYFHLGQSCRDSLLNLTDARLERVAELYARARDVHRRLEETSMST